eukprot:793838-Alexandrium_andersonii.AAC.1
MPRGVNGVARVPVAHGVGKLMDNMAGNARVVEELSNLRRDAVSSVDQATHDRIESALDVDEEDGR